MKIISIALTMSLLVGCTSKGEDSGVSIPDEDVAEGTSDGGDNSGSTDDGTAGGGTSDGGTTDNGTANGDDNDASSDGGDSDGGEDDGTATGGGTDAAEDIEIAGNYWNASLAANYTITNEDITEIKSPPPVESIVIWSLSTYNNEARYAIAETPINA